MSGHIHSEASSHECSLVRALAYDTPRLLDYSPQGVYRDSASLGTWASTQRDYHLCGGDPSKTNGPPSRFGPRLGEPRGGAQTPLALAAPPAAGPPAVGRRRVDPGAVAAAAARVSALGSGLDN